MFLDVVHDQVGSEIDHFNLLDVPGMECLPRLVGREGDLGQERVVRWIDTDGEDGVGLGVDFPDLTVVDEYSHSQSTADVEEHFIGAVVLECMAVDAVPVAEIVLAGGGVDGCFLEILQTALVDA